MSSSNFKPLQISMTVPAIPSQTELEAQLKVALNNEESNSSTIALNQAFSQLLNQLLQQELDVQVNKTLDQLTDFIKDNPKEALALAGALKVLVESSYHGATLLELLQAVQNKYNAKTGRKSKAKDAKTTLVSQSLKDYTQVLELLLAKLKGLQNGDLLNYQLNLSIVPVKFNRLIPSIDDWKSKYVADAFIPTDWERKFIEKLAAELAYVSRLELMENNTQGNE